MAKLYDWADPMAWFESLVQLSDGNYVDQDGEIIEAAEVQEVMLKAIEDRDEWADKIGRMALELELKAETKKAMAKRYTDGAASDLRKSESLKFYLGYGLKGEKLKTKLHSFTFRGKQERLAFRCRESEVPAEWKKETIVRKPDNARIMEALQAMPEGEDLGFAYIDRRKKATIQ